MTYRCTLTLKASSSEDALTPEAFSAGDAGAYAFDLASEDGLEDLPLGWVEITVRRRVINPAWLRIQETKSRSIEGQLQQVLPPDAKQPDGTPITDEQRTLTREEGIRPTVDALFFAQESKTPIWLTEEHTAYVFPPDKDEKAGGAWASIAGQLGLPSFGGDKT